MHPANLGSCHMQVTTNYSNHTPLRIIYPCICVLYASTPLHAF
ncbi:MAG: hypothetical protein BJ554DRAFT_5748 [Olpidium bornovanus]|uniref:Uncharacterized protein n=1 Tax=Olpidium bornovanus TaxID=278681 RepID=A0A8H8DKK2_9FUNG|nr:MAG: hypothetical protein BJ554DRAFT_5748 [Olpidium bornovanus]